MQEEFIDLIHEHSGEPTGESLPRAEVLSKKMWCRTTNVYVLNRQGEVLCHQRSLNKERFPGAWSTHFGGHLGTGEDYQSNAIKELEEELGVKIPFTKVVPWRTIKYESQKIWVREFMTVYDGDISILKFQKEEVEQLKWFSIDEILKHSNNSAELWIAGMHDIQAEYQCLRAVLTAGLSLGVFDETYKDLHKWGPPLLQPA